MKTSLFFVCLILGSSGRAFGQCQPEKMKMSGRERDLVSAMAERDKAMLAGDGETVERLTANEYVQTDISGYVQDRSTWLNSSNARASR